MTTGTRRPNARDKILDAAATIVAEQGVQQLTIEAAAGAAGVTKAGLIYHFKTRDDLLASLVERMARELEIQSSGRSPEEAHGSTKSLIGSIEKHTFDMPATQKRLLSNMLEAIITNPQLVLSVQPQYERCYSELERASDPGRALVLLAAIDGVLLLELLNLYKFSPTQRELLRSTLANLARDLD